MADKVDAKFEAVRTLHEGKVIAHATETCYGLAADIFQKAAVQRLYLMKKMPMVKAVSILVRDLDEAQRYAEFSGAALQLALKHWPGALTLVLPRRATLPPWLNSGHETIGIRVSSHKKTRELLELFGGPLITTSANIHGQPSPYSAQEILDQGLRPDFLWDTGSIGKNPPSTVVQVIGEEVSVLRQGSVRID